MFEVRSFLDGGDQRSRLISERIAHVSNDVRDDGVPVSQGAKEPIDIAVLRVAGIVANPHLHAGRLDLVEQFDQRKMGFEEVRFATEFGVAGILCLAERMPGIITASSCRELDRIAPAEESSAFRAVLVPFDHVLPMHNDRWMTRQADWSAFRALD